MNDSGERTAETTGTAPSVSTSIATGDMNGVDRAPRRTHLMIPTAGRVRSPKLKPKQSGISHRATEMTLSHISTITPSPNLSFGLSGTPTGCKPLNQIAPSMTHCQQISPMRSSRSRVSFITQSNPSISTLHRVLHPTGSTANLAPKA